LRFQTVVYNNKETKSQNYHGGINSDSKS
jgi:hypothetical protein